MGLGRLKTLRIALIFFTLSKVGDIEGSEERSDTVFSVQRMALEATGEHGQKQGNVLGSHCSSTDKARFAQTRCGTKVVGCFCKQIREDSHRLDISYERIAFRGKAMSLSYQMARVAIAGVARTEGAALERNVGREGQMC